MTESRAYDIALRKPLLLLIGKYTAELERVEDRLKREEEEKSDDNV